MTSLQLSDYFTAVIEHETQKPSNESYMGGYTVNTSLTASEVAAMAEKGEEKWLTNCSSNDSISVFMDAIPE